MLPVDILKLQKEHRYLSNTEEFANGTPSNRLIFKTLPNIGATHGEILLYTWRNSICLLPNVPVLFGKRESIDENGNLLYPNILIVCKGVKPKQVANYLSSEIIPKKILCTPEAYITKVKPAINDSKFKLYQDFFLLIDECDKLIRDVDYRPKIVLPINDFFDFKQKAMISATAIEPSDPRFTEHGFRILKVQPQYDFAIPVNLITTNNVVGSLKRVIDSATEQKYFIFLNSTDLTHSLISALKIEDDSKVFCAAKSVKKLTKEGFSSAYDKLSDFSKYNFFTSRFFSAVDIKVKSKPNVIMITNVDRAPFSMLDPHTDSIQIVGRLRNGVDKVVHITNINEDIKTFDEQELRTEIDDSYHEYLEIAQRKISVSTQAGKRTLKQALNGTDISLLINDDDKLDTYMVDNVILDNRVRQLYKSSNKLLGAYGDLPNFKVKYHNLKFDVSDEHLLAIKQRENAKKLCEHVATLFYILDTPIDDDGTLRFYLGEDIQAVRTEYNEIARYYDRLGFEKMEALGFYKHRIDKYIARLDRKDLIHSDRVVSDMKSLYTVPILVPESRLKADGQNVFTKHGITKPFAPANINHYYDAKRTSDSYKIKCWRLDGIR